MKTKKILILFIVALMAFSASSCEKKGSKEEGYNGVWHFDSEYHWRDPDENGDDWKEHHNFVNDVCYLCGYSRKTGTIDPGSTKPSDSTGSSSGEGEPDIDDSKPSHDEFGIGETVFDDDGFSYTEIYGNDSTATYSFGVGKNKGKGLKTLTIPEKFKDKSVTAVDDYGFKDEKSLQTVTMPESIKAIGYEAFAHCTALQEIDIPNSVTFMDHRAFLECSSLKRVTLSDQLKNLFARTFYLCTALTEIRLPEGIEYVAKSCFSRCTRLNTLYVSSTIKSLDGEAFFLCPITKVVAHSLEDWMNIDFSGSPLKEGGKLYFDKNGKEELLTEVEIPEGTTRIKQFVFTNCSSLQKITIPESVKEIGIRVFEGCSGLTELTANGITNIIDQSFQNMQGLTKVTLLGAVSIGREAFWGSFKLTQIHFGSKLQSIGHRGLANCGLTDLYLHGGTKEQWNNIFKYGDGVSNIANGDCWNYNLGAYTVHCDDGECTGHGVT